METSASKEIRDIHETKPEISHTGISIDRTNRTATLIEDAIRESGGKIPYSRFMDISLFGAEGYYSNGKVKIGKDFKTSPEWSEYFGWTIGKSIMKVWDAMGKPKRGFTIVEMGAGNGTMAKDMLVWAREHKPDLYEALNYVIVEYGDLIKNQQYVIEYGALRRLGHSRTDSPEDHARDLAKVKWIQGSASELPLGNVEGVFISNELPDAFPVEIVKKINGQIKQKFITLENDEWIEKWEDPAEDIQTYITKYRISLEENIEEPINLNAAKWQQDVDKALKRGAIITIDYGRNGVVGGMQGKIKATRTFPQEEANIEYRSPGNVDITAHVNFDVLGQVAKQDGLTIAFIDEQNKFLLQEGISEFIQPAIEEMRRTKSLRKLYKLDWNFFRHRKIMREGFLVQTLTKGISVDFQSTQSDQSTTLLDTGLRLNLGKPNTSFFIKNEKSEKMKLGMGKKIVTNADGCVSLNEADISPLMFLSKFGKYVIRDESANIILDTTDRDMLKRITETSGYEYDLVD